MSEISSNELTFIVNAGRKINWRKLLTISALVFFLVYIFFIVILNSYWVKDKITNHLKLKSDSDWTVGFISWFPYEGIKISNIESLMGDGGVKINKLNIDLSLADILSRSLSKAEITAHDVTVDIDIGWLKEKVTSENMYGNHPSNNLSIDEKSTSSTIAPESKTSNQTEPHKKTHQRTVNITKTQPKPRVHRLQKTVNTEPNRWFNIKNANISFRYGKNELASIEQVCVAVPISGKPAEGQISCNIGGSSFKQQIVWNGSDLNTGGESSNLGVVNYAWRLKCSIHKKGLPFSFRIGIPEQRLNLKLDRPNLHIEINSDSIGANLAVGGWLMHANTWRGLLNARSLNISVSENQKTQKTIHFANTGLVASLENSTLKILSAEAIGHDVSFMANGVIHKNSYTYGVVRLICNEKSRGFFEGVYHGTKLINIDESSYHLLGPLDNPDRKYCDVFIDGMIDNLEIRHNRSNSWQRLNEALRILLQFKNEELKEDGLLEDEN